MAKIDHSKLSFIIIALCAILIHKSVAIPAIAVLITSYYDNSKLYVGVWILCLVISFVINGTIKEYIVQYLGEEDIRITSYIGASEHEYYHVGFRWDFIIYSVFPIIVGGYYILKLKIADKKYRQIFNTYMVTNSFWLLVITVPFTDRFAYLSWFLYPYVLLLPYLGSGKFIQIKKAVWFILFMGGFNVLMFFNA